MNRDVTEWCSTGQMRDGHFIPKRAPSSGLAAMTMGICRVSGLFGGCKFNDARRMIRMTSTLVVGRQSLELSH